MDAVGDGCHARRTAGATVSSGSRTRSAATLQSRAPQTVVQAGSDRGAGSVLVTTPAGQLVGLLCRADLDDFLQQAAAGERSPAATSSPAQ